MKLRSKIRKGAQPAIEKGKAVTVWNKQGDTWKAVADISNTDAPPPAHKKSRSGDRPQSNLDFLVPMRSGRRHHFGSAIRHRFGLSIVPQYLNIFECHITERQRLC
jgi:hypothetical protein